MHAVGSFTIASRSKTYMARLACSAIANFACIGVGCLALITICLCYAKTPVFPLERHDDIEMRGGAGSIAEMRIPLNVLCVYEYCNPTDILIEEPRIGSPHIIENTLSVQVTHGMYPNGSYLVFRGLIPSKTNANLKNRVSVQLPSMLYHFTVIRRQSTNTEEPTLSTIEITKTADFNEPLHSRGSVASAIIINFAISLMLMFIGGMSVIIGAALTKELSPKHRLLRTKGIEAIEK